MKMTTKAPLAKRMKYDPGQMNDVSQGLFQYALNAYMTLRSTERQLKQWSLRHVIIRRRLRRSIPIERAVFQAYCQALVTAHYVTVRYIIASYSQCAGQPVYGARDPSEIWAENVQAYYDAGWHNYPF